MLTLPALTTIAPSAPRAGAATRAVGSARSESATRYIRPHRQKSVLIFAMALSAAIHAALIFGVRPMKKKPHAKPVTETPVIALVMPELKDLEEPEPQSTEDPSPKPDLSVPAPMLADVPRIPTPTDFVQALDLSSLVDRSELSQAKIYVIPEHITHGGRATGAGGTIFNFADLDRKPEPTFQPSPVFPQSQKTYVSAASVTVIFIVDAEGRVGNVRVAESTHSGFDEAATTAVQQWRFRPGMKGGRKVSTQMIIPINFHLVE